MAEAGVQEILAQLGKMQLEIAALKARGEASTSSSRNPVDVDMDQEDEEEVDDNSTITWIDVLGGADQVPTQAPAVKLLGLLSAPPRPLRS